MTLALFCVGCGKVKEEETPTQTSTPNYIASIMEINEKCENEYSTAPTEATYYTLPTEAETTSKESISEGAVTTTIAAPDEKPQNNKTAGNNTTPVATKEYILVPSVEVNVSSDIDFSTVNINHKDINILKATLKDVLDKTGIKRCPYGTTTLSIDGYEFRSGMFGIQTDENDITSFTGTQVSLEVVDNKGNLVSQSDQKKDDYDDYIIKGVHISDFFTEDDFEIVFFKGIKVGSSKNDITDILGEGSPLGKRVAYNNGVQTLIIEFDNNKVDEITLINN